MITEDYVSFETAKLLKEKGFNENTPVNYFVGDDKPRGCMVGEMIYHKRLEEDTHLIACPTLQMAMKWLREVHKINIIIGYTYKADANLTDDYVSYCFDVENAKTLIYYTQNELYGSYEQACEAAFKYCLENLI